MCKHSTLDHEPNGQRLCLAKPNCRNKCGGFVSVHACSCGDGFGDHVTVFESREEREAEGRPVDPKWMQDQNMVAGMGGLTAGYSDLIDGEEKNQMMDPKAIMGNLQEAKMIGGSNTSNPAIAGGNQKLAIVGG